MRKKLNKSSRSRSRYRRVLGPLLGRAALARVRDLSVSPGKT